MHAWHTLPTDALWFPGCELPNSGCVPVDTLLVLHTGQSDLNTALCSRSEGQMAPVRRTQPPLNTDFVSTPGRYRGPKPRPSLVMLVLKLMDGTAAVNVPGLPKPLMCFFVLRTKGSYCPVHTPRLAMAVPTQCPGPRDEHILSPRRVEARWVQQAEEWRPEEAPALIPRPCEHTASHDEARCPCRWCEVPGDGGAPGCPRWAKDAVT